MWTPSYLFYVPPYFIPHVDPYQISVIPQTLPLSYYSHYTDNLPQIQEKETHVSEERIYLVKREEQPPKREQTQKSSRFKYAKKNVESNVVNQVYSYLTSKGKSSQVLLRILRSQEKVDAFYFIMQQVKKKNTKYMGRSILQSLIEVDEDHPFYIYHKKLKHQVALKLNEARRALRILTNHFLRSLIVPTLLTSSKLDKTTLAQHLKRAKQIYCFINNITFPQPC